MAYFSDNKSKFVSLSRILLIVSFILLIATQSQAQVGREITPVTTTPVVVSTQAEPTVKLYPNPATDYITIELQSGFQKGLSLQVISFLGKKMYETQNMPQKLTLDLTEFNRGLYMYHITDATGKAVKSGKFQVSK